MDRATVVVDFGKGEGAITMDYGANEDDNWMDFADYVEIHDFHKDVDSKYIRVWASSQKYRQSTIPLLEDGSYDFTNLDKFVNAVLESDATPFMVFVHSPGTYGEGHAENPPVSDGDFADYVANVVQHYADEYGDISNWYFEVWNEPSTEIWWEGDYPRYVSLYNAVHLRIKEIAPNSKGGGFSDSFAGDRESTARLNKFVENSEMDFVSVHLYGNVLDENPNKKMAQTEFIFYDLILKLRSIIDEDIEIVQGEYNSDSREEQMEHLDEPYTAAWYASALIWQIKSQEVSLEMFYSGTSNFVSSGFGMWSKDQSSTFRLWPTYNMKKNFVEYNQKGSLVVESESFSKFLDVLAVENSDGRFITLVNKKNQKVLVTVKINEGLGLVDLDGREYEISEGEAGLSMDPYEIKFLKVN